MKLTKEIIAEGNALIAQFEGYKLVTPSMRRQPEKWDHSYWEKKRPDNGRQVISTEHTLPYLASYEALMRVVELIEELPNCIDFFISPISVFAMIDGPPDYMRQINYIDEELSKKETLWLLLVDCIKHINLLKAQVEDEIHS